MRALHDLLGFLQRALVLRPRDHLTIGRRTKEFARAC